METSFENSFDLTRALFFDPAQRGGRQSRVFAFCKSDHGFDETARVKITLLREAEIVVFIIGVRHREWKPP